MINFKKLAISFSLLLLVIVITSFTMSRSTLTNKDKWLPDDFNPKNVILLIQAHPFNEKQNDRMVEFLEKEYHWRYEVVTIEQMEQNAKYKDKKLYQFALLWTDLASKGIASGSHFVYHDIDGHFLDRSNDTEYPNSKLGIGFGQVGYRKVINAINKHFKDDE